MPDFPPVKGVFQTAVVEGTTDTVWQHNYFGDMEQMSIVMTTGDRKLAISFSTMFWTTYLSYTWGTFRVLVDDVEKARSGAVIHGSWGSHPAVILRTLVPVTAGTHTIKIQWKNDDEGYLLQNSPATQGDYGEHRRLEVWEVI